MTSRKRDAGERYLGRTLYDIAQVLESAEGSDARVRRVLELLGHVVAYEQCALLESQPGREPRVLVVPRAPPDEQAVLAETLAKLYRHLVSDHARAAEEPAVRASHLAIPLIGLDEVIGVLYVRRAAGRYTEQHLRVLTLIGTRLAAYFSMLRGRELDQARRVAEAASRAKDEFLALVSHELKTPLAPLLIWTHLLRSHPLSDAERDHAIEVIERSARLQMKLIDDLLDLSRIATKKLRLEREAVEPGKVITAAVEELRPQAEAKSIRLETTLGPSPGQFVCDPARLKQVVTNLVGNAIKFTPAGRGIEVCLDSIDGHIRIKVIDEGEGIAPDFLPHVFERFRQAESASTRGGLGLGLAIVRELVELHGGRVRAESAGLGEGATFTVELPVAAAEREPPARRRTGQGWKGRVLAGVRVLLVEDDSDTSHALKAILERCGAEVTAAASAAEALAVVRRSRLDVLVSDLAMPGESGYDLMRKIAALGGGPPAAALSAYSRIEDRERALAAGFRMLLPKPTEPQALAAAIAELAGRPFANG